MVTALEVPADKLIAKLAQYLKENVPEVKPPHWATFCQNGVFQRKATRRPQLVVL